MVEMIAKADWAMGNFIEYFYEGQVAVEGGRAFIPLNRPEWIAVMLMSGYDFADPADAEAYEIARTA